MLSIGSKELTGSESVDDSYFYNTNYLISPLAASALRVSISEVN